VGPEEEVVLGSKFCVFKKVVEMMVKLLRGNKSVMDVVGGFLLSNLEKKEMGFGFGFGVLSFVCGKMVKHENGEWGDMKMMLECVGRIYPWVCEEGGDEGEKEWVERGRALLEPIWRCYVDDGTKEHMETGLDV